ncbi:MAG: OmpA family protein [Pseudomonadota bacterium]
MNAGIKLTRVFGGMVIGLASLVLAGCAGQPAVSFESFQPSDVNAKLQSGVYKQKVDNFLVIIDASSSMNQEYQGGGFQGASKATKFQVEKELMYRMNQTIPDMPLKTGVRTFGFGPCLGWKSTVRNFGVVDYSKSGLAGALDNLNCTSGGSPMAEALEAAGGDLSSVAGKVAVILLSDGFGLDGDPVPSVRNLKTTLGDRLCLYTVWIGGKDESQGKALMNQLPIVAGCGGSVSAAEISSSQGMGDFVERVFLEAEIDSDGDGVIDSLDKCPGTPKGARVNMVGCWVLSNVLFDTDKSVIKTEAAPLLDEVVAIFNRNPGLRVEIQGHTDSVGSAAYNMGLSDRRAKAVRHYLIGHGISADRLTTKGFGLHVPIASNSTAAGRAQNRRVELRVLR